MSEHTKRAARLIAAAPALLRAALIADDLERLTFAIASGDRPMITAIFAKHNIRLDVTDQVGLRILINLEKGTRRAAIAKAGGKAGVEG